MELRVKRAPRIDLEITVPGDKSISHRAVIIAALSNGVCTVRGFLPSDDCMHTVNAMRALGIKIEQPEPATLIIHGKKRVLTAPSQEINCGNSGMTMRLLAGLLAGQKFESRLVGDPGLSKRPMDRVIAPLCEMGASVVAEGPDGTPPLRIHGGSLRGIQYRPSVASAQVKSALLLAGLFDDSPRTREIIWNFMRLRALRVEVDVKLALNQFTIDQAADYLRTAVPMDAATAHAEASLFSLTPGQAISYQMGKLQIYEFLANARTRKGDTFSLRDFHNFLWQNGNVPIVLQQWEYLGLSPPLDRLAQLH